MDKKELRLKYKLKREQLNESDIENLSLDIANQSLKLPIWNLNNYHIFLPILKHKEINTEYIIHIINGKDKNVIISKSDFQTNEMQHFLLNDNTKLITNSYGIPEPINGFKVNENDIEVVFVPLLAFDSNGNRIGYGKGFYDRFLSKCKPNTIKVGLSYFEEENEINDILPTDIKLNYCVTPFKIYKF